MKHARILVVASWCLLASACADGDEPEGDADTDASTSVDPPSSTGSAPSTTDTPEPGESTTGDATPPDTTTAPGDSGSSGDAPVGCYDYDAFVPTTVSFRADVMPILATWCSSCHADETASVYFGEGGTSEAEAVAVRTKLLDGEPKQAPHLAFVAPGDPLHSYMLAKVEYADPGGTCSEVQCSEPGCELPAPPDGPLSEPDKAVLRSWVIGGALDD